MKEKIIYWLEHIHAALAVIAARKEPLVVHDVEALTGEQLDGLSAGDRVVKDDETGRHAYTVSFKGDGGLCLTYADCDNVETVAYARSGGAWSFDSKDVTHISS